MSHQRLAVALTAAFTLGSPAQDRLFRSEDRAARAAASAELRGVLREDSGLHATVAMAAIAGTALPEGSAAEVELAAALRRANGAVDESAARERLRAELRDLVAALDFEPLIEAELPAGFPRAGVVGEIELREYPAYRMARTAMRGGGSSAFWPLFRHIQSNDIAMTTPVQMDWSEDRADPQPARMAFLYGSRAIAPGDTAGGVEVVDVAAHTVLSIGAVGERRPERVAALRARLEAWLARPDSGLEQAGPMRVMGYNSPMVRRDRSYFEVQIPVRVMP